MFSLEKRRHFTRLLKPGFRSIWIVLSLLGALATPALIRPVEAASLPASIQGLDLVTGQKLDLEKGRLSGPKGTVIVFLSAKCPCSQSHEPILKDLAHEFESRGFRFVGIHSNADESVDFARAHFAHAGLPFPVIQDQDCRLANELGALKTPHAYVFDPQGKLLYVGGVDETHIAPTAHHHYLNEALTAAAQGHEPPEKETRVLGCVIQRP